MASQRELDHQYRMRKLQLYQDGLRRFGFVFCVAIVGATVYFSFRELAGRHTFADIAFKFVADMKANKPVAVGFSWLLTFVAGAWGSSERFLRKRYIQNNHPVIEQYQQSLDAKRGSSSLTKRGTTQSVDI
jgi:hypothetical protein